MQKTVTLMTCRPRRNFYNDNLECWFKFTLIESALIGTPREVRSTHVVKVTMTDLLMNNWNLPGAEWSGITDEMVKVAFQNAEDYISEQLKAGSLSGRELSPLFLSTENAPDSCPYNLANIRYPEETSFTVDVGDQADDVNEPTSVGRGKIKILILSTDPTDASRLRLGEESREVQEKLQLAKLREQFELHHRMSVRPTDISQALLDLQPQIVHFSGHGTAAGALCFENQTGQTHPIQPDALAALFEQFTDQVDCVVLNACYSEAQANAIAKHIDYVVGMNQAIGDKAAIAFAIGFYQALGAGRTVEAAYKLGCVQIRLQGIPEHLTPVLITKQCTSK